MSSQSMKGREERDDAVRRGEKENNVGSKSLSITNTGDPETKQGDSDEGKR